MEERYVTGSVFLLIPSAVERNVVFLSLSPLPLFIFAIVDGIEGMIAMLP